jgi:hypothetical protein
MRETSNHHLTNPTEADPPMSHAETLADVFATDPPKPPKRKPATVRADWTLPTGACSECGAKKVPTAYRDDDGWGVTLDCPDDCVDPEPVAWPFVEDRATASDFEAAGWVVP